MPDPVPSRCPSCHRPVFLTSTTGRAQICPKCQVPLPDLMPEPAIARGDPPPSLGDTAELPAVKRPDPPVSVGDTALWKSVPAAPPAPGPCDNVGRFQQRAALPGGWFQAHDPELDREVAVRVVGVEGDPATGPFLRGARAAARLRHPNLLPVYEAGRHGDTTYAVTALPPGPTLAEALTAEKRLAPPRAARLAAALADALAYAHARRVLLGDLPADGVHLPDDGPLVCDFSRAGDFDTPGPTDRLPEGTPGPAGDQYRLGGLLYQMLTGRPPFDGTPEMLAKAHQSYTPTPVREHAPEVPADLEAICLKCLCKEPHQRYATARALADDLRRFLAGSPVAARPLAFPERAVYWARREPRSAVLAALAALALVAAAVAGTVAALRQ
jgi:hypothetical protein